MNPTDVLLVTLSACFLAAMTTWIIQAKLSER
jgi:organic hydroperoxide reductase OsmC/OhrA